VEHPNVLRTLSWALTTCRDETLRDPEEALRLARRAVELEPGEGFPLAALGVALLRTGDHARAVEALALAVSREDRKGSLAGYRCFLAMALWRTGKEDEAREMLRLAVEWIEAERAGKKGDVQRFRAEAEALLSREGD
jgi:tetratricopeptide (TPR) repeat protein